MTAGVGVGGVGCAKNSYGSLWEGEMGEAVSTQTGTFGPTALGEGLVEPLILRVRGRNVLLDFDLATLYEVDTRSLVQAVKRNHERFPADFCFSLSDEEFRDLRSRNVISRGHGGRRVPPMAFTEQGVAMLAGVLSSQRAVQVSIAIVRTFVKLRRLLATHAELARRLDELEQRYDQQFRVVFDAIRELMEPSIKVERNRIGFRVGGEE